MDGFVWHNKSQILINNINLEAALPCTQFMTFFDYLDKNWMNKTVNTFHIILIDPHFIRSYSYYPLLYWIRNGSNIDFFLKYSRRILWLCYTHSSAGIHQWVASHCIFSWSKEFSVDHEEVGNQITLWSFKLEQNCCKHQRDLKCHDQKNVHTTNR